MRLFFYEILRLFFCVILPEHKYVSSMARQITYTSSLPESVVQALTQYTKQVGKAKNEIIELALREFFDRQKRQDFIEGFKRANQDQETVAMAEEGMDEYLQQLDRL